MLPGMAESSPPVPGSDRGAPDHRAFGHDALGHRALGHGAFGHGPFDPRAVIEGRVPGRISVAFIVGIVITAACAIVALGIDVLQSFATGDGVVPFVIALPFALLPVPLLVAVVLFVDRLEPEPRAALVFASAGGAGIPAFFGRVTNTAGLGSGPRPARGAGTGE